MNNRDIITIRVNHGLGELQDLSKYTMGTDAHYDMMEFVSQCRHMLNMIAFSTKSEIKNWCDRGIERVDEQLSKLSPRMNPNEITAENVDQFQGWAQDGMTVIMLEEVKSNFVAISELINEKPTPDMPAVAPIGKWDKVKRFFSRSKKYV